MFQVSVKKFCFEKASRVLLSSVRVVKRSLCPASCDDLVCNEA
jgi:hypothetical protein